MSEVDLGRIEDRLDAQIGWLTTVTRGGQPQSSVVWFLADGNDILIYSKPQTAKIRSIGANSRVAFSLQSDDNGDRVTTMEGMAVVDLDPTPAHEVASYLDKYREAIARLGWTPEGFAADYSALVTVSITRIRAF